MQLAEQYFGDTEPEPENHSEPDSGFNKETEEQRRQREAAERARAEERRRRREEEERKKQEALRRARAEKLSREKQDIINQELRHLNGGTSPSRPDLFARAMQQAESRTPEDLRQWVRAQVHKANASTIDPFAAIKKRKLNISKQDSDGGAFVNGYFPAEVIVMLSAALAPSGRPGHLLEDPTVQDKRTLPQRRADAFAEILRRYSSDSLKNRGGIGTIVVSLSAKDISDLESTGPGNRYPTMQGVALTPFEILRLGAAKFDFGTVLDTKSGRPLHLGRTSRSASLEQRLALLASQLVCSGVDCDEPLGNCDVHHIRSWFDGGPTDIENLTGLCRRDHGNNRDQRDGFRNQGHCDTDPKTGRVGFKPPDGGIVFNESFAQQQSGGARTRNQSWPDLGDDPPEGHLF
ncbi:HNH endonuclease signature motif containing protein [Corynebacterium pacaense]|uniref:HNH endonuclease signature motif containing protein n=1 Tax=Corynebacterium pacaense TaxID=1816684 RepID=UPI001FE40A61|nr:HNH endonuclease signature motif containing protein [Corynebacterium pacaense]